MKQLLAWLHQPSSVAGESAIFAAISGAVLHQITWHAAATAIAGGIVAILFPDNTAGKTPAA